MCACNQCIEVEKNAKTKEPEAGMAHGGQSLPLHRVGSVYSVLVFSIPGVPTIRSKAML
jgi:hypothetical protein